MKINKVGIPRLEGRRHAVAVLVITPEGVPLVRDPNKSNPLWKAPGGRSLAGEDPTEAAIREVKSEVGLILSEDELTLVHPPKNLPGHTLSLFIAKHPDLSGIKVQGDEGEEIKVFSLHEMLSLPDFLPGHALFKQIAEGYI